MRKMENFCVDCEVCVRCHNYKDKEIAYCDICGEQIVEKYYKPEEDELCFDCAKDWLEETHGNEIDMDDDETVEYCLRPFCHTLEDEIESEVY